MNTIQIITKPNCPECKVLKKRLKDLKVTYSEWSISDKTIQEKLMGDPEFTKTFCEIDKCLVGLPAVHVEESGKYFFSEISGPFHEYYLKEIIGL